MANDDSKDSKPLASATVAAADSTTGNSGDDDSSWQSLMGQDLFMTVSSCMEPQGATYDIH
eukprot:scaffold4855_cov195-Amphora_coffeaeformis.AAC.11